ncbi:glycosyl transferase family 2 [Flavimobilis soli]|uniref:Glycosyl transferase family 2 n=1 Tax=Flavimobilis soli TaxID=442709 RepID=A0A2A9EES0_9MICO|nr:glycosyltransferase family 2 protein [Flavimobilis soli]PFG37404.1 glycosyl transferase family 2 [Flavimobilis soli]
MQKNARTTVSVVMIVKDEEAVLAKSLESTTWADQVVVYDTGSTDATREIAARYTDSVIEGYWDDDFAAARNRAQSHATGDWVLILDADEVFVGDPKLLRKRLARGPEDTFLMRVEGEDDGVVVPLANHFSDTVITGIRIYRRGSRQWQGKIHEQPVQTGASTGSALLHTCSVRHSGYTVEAVAAHDKGARNLRIAQRNLENIEATGTPAEIAAARVHVARSMVLANEPTEALAYAEQILPDLHDRKQRWLLGFGMSAVAVNSGTEEQVRLWLDEWEQHDESPVFAQALRARYEMSRGDAEAALAEIEKIPSTTVTSQGQRLDRLDLAPVEVAALAKLGRRRPAQLLARRAVERDIAPGAPAILVDCFTEEQLAGILAKASPRLWRELVHACVLGAGHARVRDFLGVMYRTRPGDITVLSAASMLAPVIDLEGAAYWSAELRRHGAAEQCLLVSLAQHSDRAARDRALAAALAISAYGDERAVPALEEALGLVAPEDEATLLAELDIVAPGLVGANA